MHSSAVLDRTIDPPGVAPFDPHPTLREIIERRSARPAEPLAERIALTPRGHAAVTLGRLRRQLADLDAADRAAIRGELLDLLDDVAIA